MSGATPQQYGEWAATVIRAFAARTNLVIAGRRIHVVGSGGKAVALTELLVRVGAVVVESTNEADYIFCPDGPPPRVDEFRRDDHDASGPNRYPLVIIDASPAADAPATLPGPLGNIRDGVSSTARPDVFLVRLFAPRNESPSRGADGRIEWARHFMPVTRQFARELADEGILGGTGIGLSMALEPKTAVLALELQDAGAVVSVFAHPDETDDAVAAALRSTGIPVWADSHATEREHREQALEFLDARPQVLVDDGSHLIRLAHTDRPDVVAGLIGATEETTSGVRPLRLMAAEHELAVPVIAANDARSKTLLDNRYGTAQSCLFAILDLLDRNAGGSTIVVIGYGYVGRGLAHLANALGASVIVSEIDAVRALEARFAGFEVRPLLDAVASADIVVSATGVRKTIDTEVLSACAVDAVIAVAGGVPQEVALEDAIERGAVRKPIRAKVDRFTFPDGRSVIVLDDGGCINITAGEGNPIEIMDLSFAVQVAAIRHLLRNPTLAPAVYDLPEADDIAVSTRALAAAGLAFDGSHADGQSPDAADPTDSGWASYRFVGSDE